MNGTDSKIATDETKVTSGRVLTCPDVPTVAFIVDYEASSWRGNSPFSLPLVVIMDENITSGELLQAVEHIGDRCGMKMKLRAAAKAWLREQEKSDRGWRGRKPGESRDEMAQRIRQQNEEARQRAEAQREAERLAAMSDEERARDEARGRLVDEFCERMTALREGIPA